MTLNSGPNAKFNTFNNHINNDIESSTGQYKYFEWPNIIDVAQSKYTNTIWVTGQKLIIIKPSFFPS